MASTQTASFHQTAVFDPAFDKVEPYHAPAVDPGNSFNADQHLAFEPPQSHVTLKELQLPEDKAISPIAITAPFPLFTAEGVRQIRADLFRKDVVEKHGRRTTPRCYKLRGYSQDTPFIDGLWRNEQVLEACSRAAGVDLAVMFDYEIGHINVQFDSLDDDMGIADVLPSADPPKQITQESNLPKVDQSNELAAVGNWHTDSYPWVCVVMLSDPSNMVGGETGLRKGDGTIAKYRGPGIGYAVMMQGGCIEHIGLKAVGSGERITMVTSFRPKDPLLRDLSNLINVKRSSKWGPLFQQWSVYRLDVLARRAQVLKERIQQGGMSAKEMAEEMASWNATQFAWMNHTATEMTGDGREGSQY